MNLLTFHHIRRILIRGLPHSPTDADDDYRQQSQEYKYEWPDAYLHLSDVTLYPYLDAIIKAGKVWTEVPYPLLILPNANMSYTIQPESYTNMNPLEFINDEYASWDLTYYMNGNLLNRIPLIKKLRWREVFCFRGLWGNLTDKNNPEKSDNELYLFPQDTHLMGKKPYMEASVGIENILNAIRVDYVWRLNYRNHPGIQKNGIRATIALSF